MKTANNKGITILELVVVLAIIAIVGAILAPNLLGLADRARLRADIQSTIVLQNSLELYRMETGNSPGNTIQTVLTRLSSRGYISEGITYQGTQTPDARWVLVNGNIRLSIPESMRNDESLMDILNPQERAVLSN